MFKSMPRLFGVLDSDGGHVDVSKTLRGAKNYATRHGYTIVTSRANGSYHARTESIKEGGKWKDNK
ncbi:hypothetical protein JT351_gp64 [Providencia phage vB_PreS-PibeRecoleta]|uniref:Uncharacterized protein n=2 Tax=Redjacvirus TaxID=2943015 RepID=A0A7G5B169_9CAUD|nr:hypothetical protein JT351_gp64 [Providencia phage vB_PreS-PibeRecoleta]YP_009999928.1 hypothetical protein JT352_gp63 [Providencia phage vB_PreS-Stilesk]ELR5076421.1 hypothetical protein [Providencia rettgeri]QMV29970.1 hypothetical protein [Providencia phage vB_PreS-PibeRecoleta]QMV30042.1 hypothetical protein [Providencia phage vB_PreS-Stilesk]